MLYLAFSMLMSMQQTCVNLSVSEAQTESLQHIWLHRSQVCC